MVAPSRAAGRRGRAAGETVKRLRLLPPLTEASPISTRKLEGAARVEVKGDLDGAIQKLNLRRRKRLFFMSPGEKRRAAVHKAQQLAKLRARKLRMRLARD